MCDRLRCEKNGQPIIEACNDCLIPTDGPAPEMYGTKTAERGILDNGDNLKNGYAERCANCKSYEKCVKEDPSTKPNTWCEDWEDIGGE